MKSDIIKGHINELFDKETELYEKRIIICKKCPLYFNSLLGGLCNGTLWINKDDEVSSVKKDGYIKGCGCRLDAKLRVTSAKCIINK